VALDIEYHRNMLDLHLRVSPKDVLIGWYSTGAGITDTDALIHVRPRAGGGPRFAWRAGRAHARAGVLTAGVARAGLFRAGVQRAGAPRG